MSIITPNIFVGEITIPQTTNQFENGGQVQLLINKYEPKFLKQLFGVTFYDEFLAGLLIDPVPAKWSALKDNPDLQSMIANYVYYWFKRNETTFSGGISELKAKAENAVTVNSVDKQVRTWNEMVEMVREFDLDIAVYPDWVKHRYVRYRYWSVGCGVPEIYYPINSLNF